MTDVVLSALAEAPCVKGGAGLFGSISSIEGAAPCLLRTVWYVLLSLGTLAHRQLLHTWPQITLT